MTDNLVHGIGLIVGMLIAVLIIVLIRYFAFRKYGGRKAQYDERQVLVRGTAYKVSLLVALFYMVFCLIMNIFEVNWAVFNVQMIIGIFISCGVFIVMCIFTNAYFGITQKSYSKSAIIYIVMLAAIGIMNIVVGVFNMHDSATFFTDGALNMYPVNFLVAIFLIIIVVALIIKVIIEKRASVEE